MSHLYQCVGCESMTLQPLGQVYEEKNQKKYRLNHGPAVDKYCKFCGRQHVVAGPIWSGPIHDPVSACPCSLVWHQPYLDIF